jgi:pyocin large subunit-like protein
MALTKVFKNLGHGFQQEIKEFTSIVRRIRLTSDTSAIGANYRKFGLSFGTYDFDAFVQKAREFFAQAHESDDPHFTVLELKGHRIAIDYNGEIRGIFTRRGKPLAFFRPDYQQLGYLSRDAELADFKNGRNVLFS